MIELIGLLGLVAFVAASFAVGVRVLLLALRTRQLPEMTVSLSLILSGGIGTALMVLPLLMKGEFRPNTVYWILQTASVSNHVGYVLLYVFVWRVFRPSQAWAACLFTASTIALLVGAGGMAAELTATDGFSGRTTPGSLWFWLSLSSRFVVYGWATGESFRYHSMLRRRLALGLAEESVVARFFYWGICTSAVLCIWLNVAFGALFQNLEWVTTTSNLISALLGFVVAGALWMAFFPRGQRAAKPVSDGSSSSSEQRSTIIV